MIEEYEIDLSSLIEREYDESLSEYSGSSLLTCYSSGQSKAFIRSFYRLMTKKDIKDC